MLSNLTAQPQDKILALMAAYRADPEGNQDRPRGWGL